MDVTQFRRALSQLHEHVGRMRGRVEVKRRGCDEPCVLISKTELESLERALEILANGPEYQAMCDEIAQLAAATAGHAPSASSHA
jgi:PHD/YefM family antitoxin component YafN of YafNO toxin-antitoxin module